jgi:putative ABC transport system permease protein
MLREWHQRCPAIPTLKAQLLQNPLIESVAAAGNPIGNNDIGSKGFNFEINGRIDPVLRVAQEFMVDEDYLPTLQIKLLEGRNFAADRPADKDGSFLVNETLVKELGWTDPIGKRVQFRTDSEGHTGEATVIGVVKDFNIYSLQHKIAPLILQVPPVDNEKDNLYVRGRKDNIPGALKFIEGVYRKLDGASPFEYHFLDANFARQYEAEKQQGSLIITLTVLAILIACLGQGPDKAGGDRDAGCQPHRLVCHAKMAEWLLRPVKIGLFFPILHY